ncbi:hypothetical protein [Rubritalea marina]|uniref:hypothetical protein n=1 Tax=Rubritalea marina TaxID=361055 RepID=UPI0003819638|nr:hypothetical protein [Rubritalea marina]
MAKGFDTHQARLNELNLFGKDLARRAKSKCELSGESGVPLKIYEVEPVPKEPEFKHCVMLSELVIEQLQKPKNINAKTWRGILPELVWSELEVIQVLAIRLLRHIARSEAWAQEVLDEAFIDETTLEWADKCPL